MSKIFNIDDQIIVEESHLIENGFKTILGFIFVVLLQYIILCV